MRAYFPHQIDSAYYNSVIFKQALNYLKSNFETCEITEKKGKLSMLVKNINSIGEALNICNKITKEHVNQQ